MCKQEGFGLMFQHISKTLMERMSVFLYYVVFDQTKRIIRTSICNLHILENSPHIPFLHHNNIMECIQDAV